MDLEKLKSEILEKVNDYLNSFNEDISKIVSDYLDENLDKDKMILDLDNFIFEMNKENNILTVALKEFISYYIKYKQ